MEKLAKNKNFAILLYNTENNYIASITAYTKEGYINAGGCYKKVIANNIHDALDFFEKCVSFHKLAVIY